MRHRSKGILLSYTMAALLQHLEFIFSCNKTLVNMHHTKMHTNTHTLYTHKNKHMLYTHTNTHMPYTHTKTHMLYTQTPPPPLSQSNIHYIIMCILPLRAFIQEQINAYTHTEAHAHTHSCMYTQTCTHIYTHAHTFINRLFVIRFLLKCNHIIRTESRT